MIKGILKDLSKYKFLIHPFVLSEFGFFMSIKVKFFAKGLKKEKNIFNYAMMGFKNL